MEMESKVITTGNHMDFSVQLSPIKKELTIYERIALSQNLLPEVRRIIFECSILSLVHLEKIASMHSQLTAGLKHIH